jgi:hypothetical protein
MKMKNLISTALTFFILTTCYAQDIVTKQSGDSVAVKIIEISPTELKYKMFSNLEGPVYIVSKSDIKAIRFENGTKEVFENYKLPQSAPLTTLSTEDYFKKGYADASIYYKGYKGAGTGTFLPSLLISPLLGLIPAIACSSTAPKDRNLNYPNPELMKNPDYYRGYTTHAKKIKQGKVWLNWGIAFGINMVFEAVMLSSPHQ